MLRTTAEILQSGRGQALRLPKAFRFDTREVDIEKEGDKVVVTPEPPVDRRFREATWDSFFASGPCPDFELDRSENQPPRERELF